MRKQSKDSLWNKLSRKLRKQRGCCEVCGCEDGLHVHHVISKHLYPSLNLNVNNLLVLCSKCHSKFHIHTLWGCDWLRTHKVEQYDWALETINRLELEETKRNESLD